MSWSQMWDVFLCSCCLWDLSVFSNYLFITVYHYNHHCFIIPPQLLCSLAVMRRLCNISIVWWTTSGNYDWTSSAKSGLRTENCPPGLLYHSIQLIAPKSVIIICKCSLDRRLRSDDFKNKINMKNLELNCATSWWAMFSPNLTLWW